MLVSKVRAPERAKHNIFQSLEIAILGKGSLANSRSKEKDYKPLIKLCINTSSLPSRKALVIHVYYFSSVVCTDLKSTEKVRGQRTVSLTFWDGSGQGEVARAGSGQDVFGWGRGLG